MAEAAVTWEQSAKEWESLRHIPLVAVVAVLLMAVLCAANSVWWGVAFYGPMEVWVARWCLNNWRYCTEHAKESRARSATFARGEWPD